LLCASQGRDPRLFDYRPVADDSAAHGRSILVDDLALKLRQADVMPFGTFRKNLSLAAR
jgi:hypothetical protein